MIRKCLLTATACAFLAGGIIGCEPETKPEPKKKATTKEKAVKSATDAAKKVIDKAGTDVDAAKKAAKDALKKD